MFLYVTRVLRKRNLKMLFTTNWKEDVMVFFYIIGIVILIKPIVEVKDFIKTKFQKPNSKSGKNEKVY